MLNIEDFDERKKKEKKDECLEYKEKIKFLEDKIKQIKIEYEEKLSNEVEKVKKELNNQLTQQFNKNLEEAMKKIEKETEEKYKLQFEERLKQETEKIKQEMQTLYKDIISQIENKILESVDNYKQVIKSALLDSLEGIFDTLSVSKANLEITKKEIEKLLNEFTSYKPIKVKVNPETAKILNFKGIVVEPVESLQPTEFQIEFEEFQIKKDFEDIKKQVLDEIKREIGTD